MIPPPRISSLGTFRPPKMYKGSPRTRLNSPSTSPSLSLLRYDLLSTPSTYVTTLEAWPRFTTITTWCQPWLDTFPTFLPQSAQPPQPDHISPASQSRESSLSLPSTSTATLRPGPAVRPFHQELPMLTGSPHVTWPLPHLDAYDVGTLSSISSSSSSLHCVVDLSRVAQSTEGSAFSISSVKPELANRSFHRASASIRFISNVVRPFSSCIFSNTKSQCIVALSIVRVQAPCLFLLYSFSSSIVWAMEKGSHLPCFLYDHSTSSFLSQTLVPSHPRPSTVSIPCRIRTVNPWSFFRSTLPLQCCPCWHTANWRVYWLRFCPPPLPASSARGSFKNPCALTFSAIFRGIPSSFSSFSRGRPSSSSISSSSSSGIRIFHRGTSPQKFPLSYWMAYVLSSSSLILVMVPGRYGKPMRHRASTLHPTGSLARTSSSSSLSVSCFKTFLCSV
mmetsp:Transcript_40246/g.65874  ORF Transcript_40246/g.65874 Transcript_40246/m.65874 type:complete len:448 (-) Transcript_40246:802-2145(-)